MKKLLIVLTILITLVAAGLAIFIATFDANRCKPELTKQLESALGSPVRIGGLSLGWASGLSFQVNQLAIYRDKASMDRPAVYLERASAHVHLMPLLSKRIEIASIALKGARFNVIKEAGGSIRINGINLPAKPVKNEAVSSAGSTAVDMTTFMIGAVKIEDANIGFVDKSPSNPMKIAVRHLDILLKNVALGKPVEFQAKLAAFGEEQNIRFQGRVEISTLTGPYVLENFKLDSDLSTLSLEELNASVPSAKAAGLTGKLLGNLSGEIKHLKMDSKGLAELDSDFSLKDGRLTTQSLRSAFENLNLNAAITKNKLNLKNFSGDFAEGKVTASGVTKNYLSQTPETSVNLKVDKIVLQDFLPQNAGRPQLYGKFSAWFNGNTKGFSWPVISNTLTGQGEIALVDGRVVNSNVLKTLFDKLAQIPGVIQALNEQLPPQYREALSQRDTVIGNIQFPVTIVNGVIALPNLKIGTVGFEIYGAGQVSLSGAVDCQATLVLDQTLSGILASRVPAMQYVIDPNGRLPFPVHIGGNVNNIKIEPETDAIFSRIMASHGQELIGNVLDKALKKTQGSAAAAGDGSSSGGSSADSYQKILGRFLQ